MLAGTGARLGVIPGGRGNDLARVLGISDDVDGAVEVLGAAGRLREIDVGEVDGKRFLGVASCGFDSTPTGSPTRRSGSRAAFVYAYAALRALVGWRQAAFTLTLDGERREFRYGVAVANNRAYGGGMFVAPDAELDDAVLDVVTLGEIGKLRFLTAILPKVFDGRQEEADLEIGVDRAAEVHIEADRPFAVYADGDPIADLPATVRVLPRALWMIVPA